MNAITIKGKRLVMNYGPLDFVEFEDEIEAVLDYNDVVVVLTVPEHGHYKPENVYGVKDNQLIWRVQELEDYRGREVSERFAHQPYGSIRMYDKDPRLVIATTGYGLRFLIDPHTGKIVGEESWVK